MIAALVVAVLAAAAFAAGYLIACRRLRRLLDEATAALAAIPVTPRTTDYRHRVVADLRSRVPHLTGRRAA